MASKFKQFEGKIPYYVDPDGKFQEKVRKLMDGTDEAPGYNNLDVKAITATLEGMEDAKTAHENAIKDINVHIEALSRVLTKRLEEQDLESVVTASGNRYGLHYSVRPEVINRKAMREFYVAEGMDDLLLPHWQNLKSQCTRALEDPEHNKMPPGVEVSLVKTARRK